MIRFHWLAAIAVASTLATTSRAQEQTLYAQAPRSARHTGTLRRVYPEVERLLNAFDYGHAIAYEVLLTSPNGSVARLEQHEFTFITKTLFEHAPRFPVVEAAVAPAYARDLREARLMFEWSHYLHRELWDIWADDRLTDAERDVEVEKALAYYRSRGDLAFSTVPKSASLMHDHAFSHEFRRLHPRFSGLLWAYHWLQLALHEALLEAPAGAERDAKVAATVARFHEIVRDSALLSMAKMPSAPEVAPQFSQRYPGAAIVFDNMHSMHDVVADALAAKDFPPRERRAQLRELARQYRDSVTAIETVAQWRVRNGPSAKSQGEGHGATAHP